MRTFLAITCYFFSLFSFGQTLGVDLNNKEDLKALGLGRIIETDNSILKNTELVEVKEYWIVYLKNESLHDKPMQSIKRIEFPNSKWGNIVMEFNNNKPGFFRPLN